MRYLEAPDPARNSSIETQRLQRFRNLLTSPINRRSVHTRSSGLSTSDSSSEESTDDELGVNEGASTLEGNYDIDNDSSDSDNGETNDLLDNLIWRFAEYNHTDDRLRQPAHKKSVYSGSTQLKFGVGAYYS